MRLRSRRHPGQPVALQAGDGPQRELLEHLVILNGLQNVFYFRGHRENVHAELQACRLISS